ncbi:hypothetical protein N1851_018389 [Merluccius polli]|uniref:Reverse transcriptase domain-containing protein n=1 Tax=Merluccius polli TaxID=89951 RepID=A0AA47MNZ1_MERPO|nr:hypothetical protein N1851_018389 [Merluccius polli]
MTAHHLKLNLDKTELLFVPGKDCLHMDLLVTVKDIVSAYDREEQWSVGEMIRTRTCIRYKTMVLAYKAVYGTAPTYLQALVRPHAQLECSAQLPQLAGWYCQL